MDLKELTIADLSAMLQYYSRMMNKVQERTPENTIVWEGLAFKRSTVSAEFAKRLENINFKKP